MGQWRGGWRRLAQRCYLSLSERRGRQRAVFRRRFGVRGRSPEDCCGGLGGRALTARAMGALEMMDGGPTRQGFGRRQGAPCASADPRAAAHANSGTAVGRRAMRRLHTIHCTVSASSFAAQQVLDEGASARPGAARQVKSPCAASSQQRFGG
jgi:hypothetical protein